MAKRVLTLVIHGTFAAEERWWRLGKDGNSTFADQLESALAARGLKGTVWKPAFDEGFKHEDFGWTGRNAHNDRKQAARKLARSLAALAGKLSATEKSPLTVHFVAHSHGGNVVMELLRHLPANVKPGEIILIGTPLIRVTVAARCLRALLCYVMLTFALLLGLFVIYKIVEQLAWLAGITKSAESEFTFHTVFLLMPLGVLLYGWVFWLLAGIGDVITQVSGSLLLLIRGRLATLYGPSERKTAALLEGRKILLLTSAYDEAGVALRLGSAPEELYREYLATRPWIIRAAHACVLRPILIGLGLKTIELFIERYMLGFNWWRVMFFDYEAYDLPGIEKKLSRIIEPIDVTAKLTRQGARDAVAPANVLTGLATELEAVPARKSLSHNLRVMKQYLVEQLKLRHSLYYGNDEITNLIAERIAGRSSDSPNQKDPASRSSRSEREPRSASAS